MTTPRPKISTKGDVVVAELEGEYDLSNTIDLGDNLLRAVPNDALGLVLDLSGVRYLDSAGVRVLFEVARKLAGCRQGLVLCVPDDSPLQRLLDLTGVNPAIMIRPSRAQAMEGLRQSAEDRI